MIQRFKKGVKKDGFPQTICHREAVECLLFSCYYTVQKVSTHLDELKEAPEKN